MSWPFDLRVSPAPLIGAVFFAALVGFPGWAEQVTVTARDGVFEVTGDLVGFDDTEFRLQTDLGVVVMSRERSVCTGSACPAENESAGLTVSADAALAEVAVPALIRAFAASQDLPVSVATDADGVQFFQLGDASTSRSFPISVSPVVSAEAFADLAVGDADLAITTRIARPAEITIVEDAGRGRLDDPSLEHLLALDALVLVASARRAVGTVNIADFERLLATGDKDWQSLGQAQGPLQVHLRANALDVERLGLSEAIEPSGLTYHANGRDLAEALRDQTGGIGLSSLSEIGSLTPIALRDDCGFEFTPTRAAVSVGRYPWIAPVMGYISTSPTTRVLREFLDFAKSPAASDVFARAGFSVLDANPVSVPLQDEILRALRETPTENLERLQELAQTLDGTERLAVSLPSGSADRFASLLRERSLAALADHIALGDDGGSQILLLGFGTEDDILGKIGQAKLDLLARLTDRSDADARVKGAVFGDLLPLGCDPGPVSSGRIEVWRKPGDVTATPRSGN